MDINSEFSFDIERFVPIAVTQKALQKYSEGLKDAESLSNEIPIFLDTNVLLEYYKISFSERKEVKEFFLKNKGRIYLTHQIEKEFLRHRIDHINAYQNSLNEFINSFKNIKEEVEYLKAGNLTKLSHYIDKNKILINDYQQIKDELIKLRDDITIALQNAINHTDIFERVVEKEKQIEEEKKKLEGQADIERNDDLLDIIAEFKVVEKLSEAETSFLIEKFNQLKLKYDEVKPEAKDKIKWKFPGCGENKQGDKTGDFIIYHEILKFLKKEGKDGIFLTSDVTKDDWLLRSKSELVPYTHYILNSYANTQQTLYIFQAKDKIRISYDKIYSPETEIEYLPLQISNEQSDELEATPVDETNINLNAPSLRGLKILGRIDLSRFKVNEGKEEFGYLFEKKEFKKITESEFLHELDLSKKWADNYGSGFVGKFAFVRKFLGFGKGYNIGHTFSVLDNLVKQGKVEEYVHVPVEKDYKPVDAIRKTPDA